MNIVNQLTLRHLKGNKGRTIITTLGICVSVAMITAVFVALASMMNLFTDIEILSCGHQQASANVNVQQLEKLRNDDRIDKLGINIEHINNSYYLGDDYIKRNATGSFFVGDKALMEQFFTGSYDGAVPLNKNEIAVEEEFIKKNNLDWKLGDTVTIPCGSRYFFFENEQQEMPLVGEKYISGEFFVGEENRQFKITAIMHENPATCQMYSIIQGFDSSSLSLGEGETVKVYINLEKLNSKSRSVLEDMMKEYSITEYMLNNIYLDSLGSFSEGGVMMSFMPIAIVILVIIMIASVVFIYNSFGMSLAERVRYLGMLASVGATRKQKKLSVYYEGMILGLVGIPVGMIAGIAGIGITLKAVGKKIIETSMIMGVSESEMNMKVVAPLWALIGIVFFSVITTFISSFIPSRKASRITPVNAIRQNNEIKIKSKKLKSPKIIRKIFGYEGELAHKNLKRNGRKSRVITASIAMSVILFLSCNYFCSLFGRTIGLESRKPYQIEAFVGYTDMDKFEKAIDDISGVDKYYTVNNDYFRVSPEGEGNTENSINKSEFLTSTYKDLFKSKSGMYINYIDDTDFNKLCTDNGIDYKTYYNSGEMKALVMNNISHENGGKEVFNDSLIGYNLYNRFVIGGFVSYNPDNYVCNLNIKSAISVYVPFTQYKNDIVSVSDEGDFENLEYFSWDVGIVTDDHEGVMKQLQNVFDSENYEYSYLNDHVESLQMMNTILWIMQVFVYGFITLISFITLANIINTISTGVAMRKKEFAMLKSVGTTPKGFRKMVSLESVFYEVKALLFALPTSVLISFGMNKILTSNALPFELDWKLYLCVTAVILAVVGSTMLYAVSRLKNDSIVETLKEDIS